MSEQNIRPLTRQEQLEWLVPFLEGEIEKLQQKLYLAKQELEKEQIKNKKLTLTKKEV